MSNDTPHGAEDTAALRALVAAAEAAMAVLDGDGMVLAANLAYRLHVAAGGTAAERRAEFSPDGVSRFTLVTLDAPTAVWPSVVDILPVVINLKDRDSNYMMMNRYQAALYGTTPAAAIGRSAVDLLGPDYGGYTRGVDAAVIASGAPTPFYDETYPGTDGVVRRWLTSKVPVSDGKGGVCGVATVSMDISDRARVEETLRQSKEEAEAASRAKSGFLAAMSHELRTPLNAVIGFAEIMHQQALGPLGAAEYADYAGHILSSGRHLLSLINDVLDFARIEAGSLTLTIRPLDLGALLRASLAVIERDAAAAGVTLVADISEQKVIIRADSQRLRQVMVNVAGNAVKFTPRGGLVSVTMRPDMRGGAWISVADSGVGVSAADLPNIFEPFWQADSGLDRLKEGAGIGLPLARQLVALHGGRLELESRQGEGTKVTVILPEHRDAPAR